VHPNIVYIAGPMRGYPMFNFPAFDAARDAWAARGWTVISPADMDRELDGLDPTAINTDSACSSADKPFAHYMRRDIEALLRSTAIAFLPGWEASVGANVERVVAGALNLEMYDALTFEPVSNAPNSTVVYDGPVPLCHTLDYMIRKYGSAAVHHTI
jgi:hypothetical protein